MADPGLELLLDPDRLGDLLRRDVRVAHLRPKPGVSHVGALVPVDGAGGATGWVQLLLGRARVKGAKARARAERLGLGHLVSTIPLPQWDAELLWGAVASDPRLGRVLASAGLQDIGLGEVEGEALLRYNPLRRLVLRADDRVVRVTAGLHRHRLEGLARELVTRGVPVLGPAPWPGTEAADGHVSCWPWVEGHDLAGARSPEQLRDAGRVLALLHTVTWTWTPGELPTLPTGGWGSLREGAARAVKLLGRVAPELGRAAWRALAALPDEIAQGAPVMLHGDLSLDQYLAGRIGSGPQGLWLTDLDRARLGPGEQDLGSALAAEVLALLRTPSCSSAQVRDAAEAGLEPFVEGYAVSLPGRAARSCGSSTRASLAPAGLGPWAAAALLGRAMEPWRAQEPGWEERTRLLLQVARDLAAGGAPTLVPRRAEGSGHAGVPGVAPGARVPVAVPVARVPVAVPDGAGGSVVVGRAWPAKDGGVDVEGRDAAGRLRAGRVHPGGRSELLPPGEDERLPGLPTALVGGELVVHRRGRRAVVRRPDGYVKVLRRGRAEQVVASTRLGSAWIRRAGMHTPQVLHVGRDTVRLAVAPGTPVGQLAAEPGWGAAWEAWAKGWTRLHRLSPAETRGDGPPEGRPAGDDVAAEAAPRHTSRDEAAVLLTWRDRAAATGVVPTGTTWHALLTRTARELAASPAGALVPAHRDLHDGQLLWDGARLSVLDLDTAALAEPALDLANLAVHARLRVAQGAWSAEAAAVVEGAVDAVAGGGAVDPRRLALARRATLARLVAVYAFRPRWADLVRRWARTEWERETAEWGAEEPCASGGSSRPTGRSGSS